MDLGALLEQLFQQQYAAQAPRGAGVGIGNISPQAWETSAYPNKMQAMPEFTAEPSRYEAMQLPPVEFMRESIFPQARGYADYQDPTQNSFRAQETGIGPTVGAAARGRMNPNNPRR